MSKNRKFNLNFAKSGIFGHSSPCMTNIYQCTKFDENIFIYDPDMAKNGKFKMTPTGMLILRCNFGPQ